MSRIGLGYGLDGYWNHRTIPATWVSFCTKETSMPETKITDAHVSRFIEAMQKNLARVDVTIDHMTDNMSVGGLRINRSEIRAALEAAMIDGPRPRTNAELHEAIDAAGPHGFIQVTREELDRIKSFSFILCDAIGNKQRRKDDPK